MLVERFVQDFCKSPDFFPDGEGPVAPNYTDEELREKAIEFQKALKALAPISEAKVEALVTHAARDARHLSAEARTERLLPLIENGVHALQWGESGPHKPLFDTFWWASCADVVERAAHQQLIFRPPTVITQWENLLTMAIKQMPDDPDAVWIRLVSGERSGAPFSFWHDAQQPGTDAAMYEEAVRRHARDLSKRFGRNCVERRFLFDRNYFRMHPEDIARFEGLLKWMTDGHIDVSVGRLSDAGEPKWGDFAILGNLAVSRFQDLGRIENRALVEDFSNAEIQNANTKWQELIPDGTRKTSGASPTTWRRCSSSARPRATPLTPVCPPPG